MNLRAIIGLTAGVLFCALLAYFMVVRFTSSYAVPIASFDRVVPGMTKVEVQAMLGRSHHIRHDTPQSTAFYYGGWGRLQRCIMEVYFGADDRVTGKFHDD